MARLPPGLSFQGLPKSFEESYRQRDFEKALAILTDFEPHANRELRDLVLKHLAYLLATLRETYEAGSPDRRRIEHLQAKYSVRRASTRDRAISPGPLDPPMGSELRRPRGLTNFLQETSSVKADIPAGGEGERSLIRRIPHIDLSVEKLVAPNARFFATVCLDDLPARPDEKSVAITATDGSEVEVHIGVSSQFEIIGNATRRFFVAADKTRIEVGQFEVICLPRTRWQNNAGSIFAAFFVDGRPCGSVVKKVSLDDVAEISPVLPPPQQGPIEIGPNGMLSVDLTVTILADAANDGRSFWCYVDSPHLHAPRSLSSWNLSGASRELVQGIMDQFVCQMGTQQVIAELRGAGRRLFEIAPRNFREAYWELYDRGIAVTTVAVVSEEPFIPWELMIPSRQDVEGRWVDVSNEPLGVTYVLGRWVDGGIKSPLRKLPLKGSLVVAPVYATRDFLKNSANEAAFVLKTFPGDQVRPADYEGTVQKLASAERSLVHFVCHGKDQERGIQRLLLENNDILTSTGVLGIPGLAATFGKSKPVVFLNACEVGRPAPSLIGLGGFARSFIQQGAAAVIAPLWSVDDEVAHEIALAFYSDVASNPKKPFAKILASIRAKAYVAAGAKDTYAAYCFYGDPLACAES